MTKIKKSEQEKSTEKIEEKEILLDDEEKVIDPDIIIGDVPVAEEDEDEDGLLDDDEIDPFKDKWEE